MRAGMERMREKEKKKNKYFLVYVEHIDLIVQEF